MALSDYDCKHGVSSLGEKGCYSCVVEENTRLRYALKMECRCSELMDDEYCSACISLSGG